MSYDILGAYIRQCVNVNASNPDGVIFTWQGGEPTLMGLDFYKKALNLEKQYAQGRPFTNSLQTNGTLLDDRWCEFLAVNKFLVGLSLDGPQAIHDSYRVDAQGKPTFKRVLRSLRLLQKHGVDYNVLACVARQTAKFPLEVYDFFKSEGVRFVQFSPIVERIPDEQACSLGLRLAMPPSLTETQSWQVTDWTVEPEELGNFYGAIFDRWVRNDVGQIFVMNFEWAIFSSLSGDGPVCYLNKQCGNCCIVESNGDVYACDHFVYPEYKLGNILTDDVNNIINSANQRSWGARKESSLPNCCKDCDVFALCRCGCPKHRFALSDYGEPGSNYLCRGYKKFYRHIKKYLRAFGYLVEHELPCEYIMQAIACPTVFTSRTTGQQLTMWIK